MTVLWLQEVKQRIPGLFVHEIGTEWTTVSGNKLRREFDNIDVERLDGWRIHDELKVGWWLFRNDYLLNDL